MVEPATVKASGPVRPLEATTSGLSSLGEPQTSVEMASISKSRTDHADPADQQQQQQSKSSGVCSSVPVPGKTDNGIIAPSSTAAPPPSTLEPAASGQYSAPSSASSPGAATEPPLPSATEKGKAKDTAAATKPRQGSLEIDNSDAAPATPAAAATTSETPTCNITLLLPTGARHPYRIDERYLSKRNVEIPDLTEDGKKDPFSISVYKLKELILREWREEWEGRPASPSSIRLIHFGKLLDDKEQLKKYQLSAESPNVIHMSVRPAEMMEEDEGAKGPKTSSSGGRTREGGGCCVIL